MDQNGTAYDQLYVYTMGRPGFILQHVVDAHAAQSATVATRPMALFFALAGLFLYVERGLSGRDVQRLHMLLARSPRQYPRIALPAHTGMITAGDVLAASAGAERDAAVGAWCRSVWEAFGESRHTILAFLEACDIG